MSWQNYVLTQSHYNLIPLRETYCNMHCRFIDSLPSSICLSWISDTDKALKEQKMRDPQWDRAGGLYTDKGNADRHRPTHTYTHVKREALVCSLHSNVICKEELQLYFRNNWLLCHCKEKHDCQVIVTKCLKGELYTRGQAPVRDYIFLLENWLRKKKAIKHGSAAFWL